MPLLGHGCDQPLQAQVLVSRPGPEGAAGRGRVARTVRAQRQRLEVVRHVGGAAARAARGAHWHLGLGARRLALRLLELEAEVPEGIGRLRPPRQGAHRLSARQLEHPRVVGARGVAVGLARHGRRPAHGLLGAAAGGGVGRLLAAARGVGGVGAATAHLQVVGGVEQVLSLVDVGLEHGRARWLVGAVEGWAEVGVAGKKISLRKIVEVKGRLY